MWLKKLTDIPTKVFFSSHKNDKDFLNTLALLRDPPLICAPVIAVPFSKGVDWSLGGVDLLAVGSGKVSMTMDHHNPYTSSYFTNPKSCFVVQALDLCYV